MSHLKNFHLTCAAAGAVACQRIVVQTLPPPPSSKVFNFFKISVRLSNLQLYPNSFSLQTRTPAHSLTFTCNYTLHIPISNCHSNFQLYQTVSHATCTHTLFRSHFHMQLHTAYTVWPRIFSRLNPFGMHHWTLVNSGFFRLQTFDTFKSELGLVIFDWTANQVKCQMFGRALSINIFVQQFNYCLKIVDSSYN